MKSKTLALFGSENICDRIYTIREQRVILDADLASLYGVATRVLNQAIKRDEERFPLDYMFQLVPQEVEEMWSQFVTT